MNALANAIQSEQLTGTAAEIAAAFAADATLLTDSTTYSLVGVGDRLIAVGVDVGYLLDLRSHIRTLPIGGDTMEGMLLTAGGSAGGVDFSRDVVRYQLAANLQHPSITAAQTAIVNGMLAIGVTTGPRWQKSSLGLSVAPDETACQAALDEIATQQKWAQFSNEIVPPMLTAGSSWAEIIAAGESL